MPYCPKCKAEYREGFRVCVDCKVPLVRTLDETVEASSQDDDGSGAEGSPSAEYLRLLRGGEEAYDGENYRNALNLLNEASQLEADDSDVWALLGLTYQALGAKREAWRSFKFALRADSEDTNALWYAAQFLFEEEDYEMAMSFVRRYLELEDDPAERKEAETLSEDIAYHLAELAALAPKQVAPTGEEPPVVEEEIPSDKFTVIDDLEDEEDFEDDEWVEEAVEAEPEEPAFLADLALMLTDRSSKCIHCGTALPTDAPYCYHCKKPHLYQPLPD